MYILVLLLIAFPALGNSALVNSWAPDFLVLGAQKSGTTALYHMLVQHPQVVKRKGEIHFFRFYMAKGSNGIKAVSQIDLSHIFWLERRVPIIYSIRRCHSACILSILM